ncbi:Mif2/CENP-C like-domain-containing protein [Lentinula boryana]|uniref:Mif2/CENP-C like-domain-containing protein n=1 Tax=Lentinula boryana TaxID=40481 RepID=A0ABQ8Q6U0_9AGAR|nr:Mif2/CENP-C like-domain-containing protein [Lentinula boryana]
MTNSAFPSVSPPFAMSSTSSESTITPSSSQLTINTSEEALSTLSSSPTPNKKVKVPQHEGEHEPDTPTSSTSSSTSSFTTVTADILTYTDEHTSASYEPPLLSSSSNLNPSSSSVIDQPVATSSSKSSPPPPPKTIKRRSKSSTFHASFPEQGWDDDTPTNGNVLDFRTEQPVSRRLTHTEKLIAHSLGMAYEGNWSFCKVFADGSFVASGYIHIFPGGRKSSKTVKDNTYIFHVVEGVVNVKIHDTAYIIAQGGSFMVPRGNIYFIENICERTTKLMFVQAREVTAGEQDDPLRLVRGQPPPKLFPALPKSKLFILLGWVIERLFKRFVKYRKAILSWYLRSAMQVGRSVQGPKAYIAFFVLGFLFRSLGPSRSLLPRVNVQVIRE